MKSLFRGFDLIILAGLGLFVCFFALFFVNFKLQPIEDAAMLMRYADHFAHGFGIVWNIGEAPVDGATDFLFMVVLAGLVKSGLPLEFATRLIGFLAHLLTVWLVYLSLRQIFETPRPFALISALYLAIGPGLFFVAGYFGTSFFALFAALTWYFALNLIQTGSSTRNSLLFALMALMTALIRPEGVILTGWMLFSIVFLRGFQRNRQTVLYFLIAFLVLGGLYFFWRWNYFGYPLPNPFYKKGGGRFYPFSFQMSFLMTFILTLPFLPAILLGFLDPKTRRLAAGVSLPVLGFASAFILLSNEMNFGGRFQYALLPLVLMTWWPLTSGLRARLRISDWEALSLQTRVKILLPVFLVAVGVLGYMYSVARTVEYFRDGKYDVAILLSDYQDKNLTMATSEAGLLPLYSRWRALDLWGLNDQWIAHHGQVTDAYLELNPHLIIFHVVYPASVTNPRAAFPIVRAPLQSGTLATKDQNWYEMATTVKAYAEKKGYILAGAFGVKPNDIDYYYVQPDFPESAEIIRRIQALPYSWTSTGGLAKNYALP